MLHKNITVGDVHYIQQWEPADSTARLALTVAATDVGKIARQVDTNIFYILTDDSPMTWQAIGTNTSTVTGTGSANGTNTGDQNLFSTIAVSGQSNVVADTTTDTLTLVAGTNVTITTDAATDSITINSSGGAGGNSFETIAVSGQSNVVAESSTDTLTLVAGTNVTITTDAGTDTITINATGGNSFGTVAVSGQSDVVADAAPDTLTLAAGSGIAITTNAGTDTVTIATSGVATVGKSVIGYWPAGAMKPSTTNGAAPLVWDESGTNDVMTGYLAFDAAAVEYAQFSFKAPQGLDEGTMTATFEWYEAAGASAHVCVWQIEMLALADADTIDTAWGTAVTVSDTGTSGTFRISPETGAITPGNTWAAGDEIFVRVSRLATDGSDTLDVDAKLMGVHINATYTTLIEP